jgi:hypothetical protein
MLTIMSQKWAYMEIDPSLEREQLLKQREEVGRRREGSRAAIFSSCRLHLSDMYQDFNDPIACWACSSVHGLPIHDDHRVECDE